MEPVVIKFSAGVLAIPFVVAAIGVVAAIAFAWRREWFYSAVALLVAAIAGLIFGPSMLNDRVVITEDRIQQTTGFVWSPTVKGFEFDQVDYVLITEKRTGPKRRLSEVWEVHSVHGPVRDIDPGDLWEGNSNKIARLLRERGVDVR